MTCVLNLDEEVAELNITIYRGLDGIVEIEVVDSDTDLPFNFTDGSFKAEMRAGVDSNSDLVIDLNPVFVGSPTNGVFRAVNVDKVDTAAITQDDGDYFWDCLYTDDQGDEMPWIAGVAVLRTARTEPS